MFYFLFTLLAVYTVITLAFAITSFGERCMRAAVLGSVMFLIMLGLLGLYGRAETAGLLSGMRPRCLRGSWRLSSLLFTFSLFVPLGRNHKALSGTKGMAAGAAGKGQSEGHGLQHRTCWRIRSCRREKQVGPPEQRSFWWSLLDPGDGASLSGGREGVP